MPFVRIEGEMTMPDQPTQWPPASPPIQWPPTTPPVNLGKRQAICICPGSELSPIIALCSDGSIWYMSKSASSWTRVLDIPQDETSK